MKGGSRQHGSMSASHAGLTHLAVAGYRSLQQLTLPLGGLTLVCGANGCGKSNLYRARGLISAAARGDLVATLAAEGGLPAVFWAGPERTSAAMRRGEQPVQGSSRRSAWCSCTAWSWDMLLQASVCTARIWQACRMGCLSGRATSSLPRQARGACLSAFLPAVRADGVQ